MPRSEEDWSDSEESLNEQDEEGYTSVHLGVPSDRIEDESDLHDAYVSRIGGTPAFLGYPHPPLDFSKCKICKEPAELLVQILCNLEESPFERVLYVWGCSKATCQKKDGVIRAWRYLRFDPKYAKKLGRKEKQKSKIQEPKVATKINSQTQAASNPFSASSSNPFSSGVAGSGFGFGDEIMGFAQSSKMLQPKADKKIKEEKADFESNSESEISDDEEIENGKSDVAGLSVRLQATSLGPSIDWTKQPQYIPFYLDTESEYLAPTMQPKQESSSIKEKGAGRSSGGEEWGKELWENSQNIDDIFLYFTTRLGSRPKQCLRYEIDGAPLFYQEDAIYRSLHSIPAGTSVPVTGAAFVATSAAPRRTYNPSGSTILPKCPGCSSTRRFECQLMPNLINMLKRDKQSSNTEESQMEWGTCLVYTCPKNCCQEDSNAGHEELKECWREEKVLVQWED
ncbi:hypothetical protein FRC17_009272 [Serendipita sp. 399]|nr:hypothetical protein FRC17_009272 [Serendipita sp. 399]